MDKAVLNVRREQWRKIVIECNNSGLTKTEWCQQNGVSLRGFHYWQNKFRKEILSEQDVSSVPALSPRQLPEAAPDQAPAMFVDVTDKFAGSQDLQSRDSSEMPILFSPELMIHVADKQVYVNGNIQPGTLETVIRVISHA